MGRTETQLAFLQWVELDHVHTRVRDHMVEMVNDDTSTLGEALESSDLFRPDAAAILLLCKGDSAVSILQAKAQFGRTAAARIFARRVLAILDEEYDEQFYLKPKQHPLAAMVGRS